MTRTNAEYMRQRRIEQKKAEAALTAVEIGRLLDLDLDQEHLAKLQKYLLDNTRRIVPDFPVEIPIKASQPSQNDFDMV